jgi:hypothetical protein
LREGCGKVPGRAEDWSCGGSPALGSPTYPSTKTTAGDKDADETLGEGGGVVEDMIACMTAHGSSFFQFKGDFGFGVFR